MAAVVPAAQGKQINCLGASAFLRVLALNLHCCHFYAIISDWSDNPPDWSGAE